MTWGEQNTEAEAHEQLDYALDRGINFIDVAEMYPVPGRAETQGLTEQYIGTWIEARQNRDKYILATKVTGRSGMTWVRDGKVPMTRHTPEQIDEAVEKSLKRLKTDYIDLYQLHWPDRGPFEDILGALNRHVEKGNIREIGVSNESAWGTMKFLQIAEQKNWPRMVSNQAVYSLVARRFDYDRAEVAMREDVGLLAYSPLAMGLLTGKYDNGDAPKGSRKDLFPSFLGRYEDAGEAVLDCNATAKKLGLTPTQFSLKFVESRGFVTSNIIGATSIPQLKENIDAHDIVWTKEMEQEATRIHKTYRSPAAG